MTNDLEQLISEASSFIQSEFQLKLNKSTLKVYPKEAWQRFYHQNKFETTADGLYVPYSYTAYTHFDSPTLVSDIFHELFGHGLFIEHSSIGKKLREIIQNNQNEKKFLFEKINPLEQPLGLCTQNIGNYEGFAVWLEALLCKETNNSEVWKLKKDRLSQDYRILYDSFQEAERALTRFGFMSQLGFPKHYDNQRILSILKNYTTPNFPILISLSFTVPKNQTAT